MSLVQDAINKSQSLLLSVSQAGLNAIYPNEFEFYLVALELVDQYNNSIDYFSFPISPDSINEIQSQITNIKNTSNGIISMITNKFVPKVISMKGTFGRRFRVLLKNNATINFSSFSFSGFFNQAGLQNNVNILEQATFDPSIKSGYGSVKCLEAICKKSLSVDQTGNPMYKLFFYNPILGNNYMVEVIEFESSQNMERNRIPSYSLQLKAIAPLENIVDFDLKKSMVKNLTADNLSKGANMIANQLRKVI